MNAKDGSKDQIAQDATELAQLLEVGMIDYFVDQFKVAVDKSENSIGQLVSVINDRLSRNQAQQKWMPARLEIAECSGGLPPRVDVVTPCRFVGRSWSVRRSIEIARH